MRNLVRDFQILKLPAKELQMKCQTVRFPLSPETVDDIYYLKSCLRKTVGNPVIRTLALSAPQVGITKRFFVIPQNLEQIQKSQKEPTVSAFRKLDCFINPHIQFDDQEEVQALQLPQICLSVSDEEILVERPLKVFARYYDVEGRMHDQWLTGVRARVFQHELDHLNGMTIERFKNMPKMPQRLQKIKKARK